MLKRFILGLVVMGLTFSLSGIVFGGRVEVTFLIAPYAGYPMEMYRKLEAAFESEYPSVDLVYETTTSSKYQDLVLLRGAMGDLPDIWHGAYDQRFDRYASAGLLMPLDSLIEEEGIDLSRYSVVFKRARRDGKTYAFTWVVQPRGFINYNKDMFDEAGVSYPTDKLTWKEFREICRKLTVRDRKGNVTRYACFNKYPMLDVAYAFGGRIVDNPTKPTEALFGHDKHMAGMREYLEMVDEGVMMPRRVFDALGGSKPKIFCEGKIAMLVSALGYGGGLVSPFEWDVIGLPLKENGAYHADMGCFFISSDCKHPNEAIRFVGWYVFSVEAMKIRQANFGTNAIIPLSLDLQEEFGEIARDRKPDNWKCTYRVRESIVGPLSFEGCSEFDSIWWSAIMDIVYGRKPLDSLMEVEKECQGVLDKLPWNK